MKRLHYFFACLFLFTFSCKKDNEVEPSVNKSELQEVIDASYSNKAVNSVLVDNSSIIWVGTESGLYLLIENEWYEHSTFSKQTINSITSHEDEILIATSQGAYTLNSLNNSFNLLESITNETIGGTSNEVSSYAYGIFDKKWIGTTDELAFYDGTNWNRNSDIKNNLGGISDISSMAFRSKDCFFGTNGKYMYHLVYNNDETVDAISGASQMLGGAEDAETNFNGELTSDTVFCVFAGTNGWIWFGSTMGLSKNRSETTSYNGEFEYFLRGERVRSVIETSDLRICAGTENGLSILNGSEWANYSTTDGLPGNVILSIAEDEDQSIWVGTDKGLSHFQDGAFVNY